MLLQFSVENYKSFKDLAEISLVRGPTRDHDSHVVKAEKRSGISGLRTALVYGANASGKSNLVKAIADARELITRSPRSGQAIKNFAFKLNTESIRNPTKFHFTIKVAEDYYEFSFSTGNGYVHEESLSRVTRSSQYLIYKRTRIEKNKYSVESDLKRLGKKDKNQLYYEHEGVRENTLFLNQCVQRNIPSNIKQLQFIDDVFRWFDNDLIIIFPDGRYGNLEMEIQLEAYQKLYSSMINHLGTGVDSLESEKVSVEEILEKMPEQIREEFMADVEANHSYLLSASKYVRYLIVADNNAELVAFKLNSVHTNEAGEPVLFDLDEESDGTNRLLDLVPGLVNAVRKNKTYIVDELDRSLHPDLTRKFISHYLELTEKSKSQLIVTTHDLFLMDLNLVRRDELWYTQKKRKTGESQLYSLEEFEGVEKNTDVLLAYRQGRFGGKPFFPKNIDLEDVSE